MSVQQTAEEILADVKAEIRSETAAGWMKAPEDTFAAIETAIGKAYLRGCQDQRPEANEPTTEIFVQWKGTEVCLDFTCACGMEGHFDGDFAYHLMCASCGKVWEMPTTFTLRPSQDADPLLCGGVQSSPREHEIPAGPDMVTVERGEW